MHAQRRKEPLHEPNNRRIPKRFRLKAQGCEERATLGTARHRNPTPTGCGPSPNGGRTSSIEPLHGPNACAKAKGGFPPNCQPRYGKRPPLPNPLLPRRRGRRLWSFAADGKRSDAAMNPFAADFKARAQTLTHDLRHRQLIQTALRKYEVVRDRTKAQFQDWEAAREAAARTKWEAVNHLDKYLRDLVGKLEARARKFIGPAPASKLGKSFWESFARRRPAASSNPRP